MGTVDALEKEIAMQLDFIKKFVPQKTLSAAKQKKTIFCGTGDSFASSHLGEVFSKFRARAFDPLDLIKTRSLLLGHTVYAVSVSGNTASNIKLAKLHGNTIAITANKESRLAKACRGVILLKLDSTGIQTAGSISFLASALTCISLVTRYHIRNPSKIYREAARAARGVLLSGKVYILGSLYTMPVAMFCAAKLYEVLGADAHYQRIEQFSHMELFSAKRGDTVILFESRNEHNQRLEKNLAKCGLVVKRLESKSKNLQEQILFYIFVSQLIALYNAKKKKKKECFFIEENRLRNASSSMIY